jgi:hypothetical protein
MHTAISKIMWSCFVVSSASGGGDNIRLSGFYLKLLIGKKND